jgi:hypothetical protein
LSRHEATLSAVVIVAMVLSITMPLWHRHDHNGATGGGCSVGPAALASSHHESGCQGHSERRGDATGTLSVADADRAAHACPLCVYLSQRPTPQPPTLERTTAVVEELRGTAFDAAREPVYEPVRFDAAPRGPPPSIA